MERSSAPLREPLLAAPAAAPPPRLLSPLLCCAWLVYGTLYASVLMIASFFPTSPSAASLSPVTVGAIFAAFPLATFLATPLPPLVLGRLGTRATVGAGLVLGSASTLCFGAVPWLRLPPASRALAFLLCRALAGVGSALAEAACLAAISTHYAGASVATALATLEVVAGVGATAGSALGGALYAAGAATPLGPFATPFACSAALQLAPVPLLVLLLPPRSAAAAAAAAKAPDAAMPSLSSLMDRSRVVLAASVVATAAVAEALNPLMAPHLRRRFHWDAAEAGLYFAVICAAYMLAALPVGRLADRAIASGHGARRLKLMLAGGWVLSGSAHMVVGPAAALAPHWLGGILTVAAAPLLGLSAAALIVPSLPALEAGIEGDEEINRVASLWNGLYSLGSAAGPLASSALHSVVGFAWTCAVLMLVGASAALVVSHAARPHGFVAT